MLAMYDLERNVGKKIKILCYKERGPPSGFQK